MIITNLKIAWIEAEKLQADEWGDQVFVKKGDAAGR